MVAAITFDEGWAGTLEDGSAVTLCPTSLGQIGGVLPAGEHVLTLTYRDAWVRVGAATSAPLSSAGLWTIRLTPSG